MKTENSEEQTANKALHATAPVPTFYISLDAFDTMSNRRDMRSDVERGQAYGIRCENPRATLLRVAQMPFGIVLDLIMRNQAEIDACLQVLRERPAASADFQR